MATAIFSGTNLRVQIAPGADRSAASSSWTWTDVTSDVRVDEGIEIEVGRADESGQVDPGKCTLTFDNSSGNYSRLNPNGTYYGTLTKNTPLRVQVDNGSGYVTRFIGEVVEWPPRWDKSENLKTVPIVASGYLRRLGQGASPLKSVAYRALTGPENDSTRIAYWPLEEESDATTISSPYGDGPVSYANDISFGADTESASSARLATFGTDGLMFFIVPTYTSTEHKVCNLWRLPTGGLTDGSVLMRMYCTGGNVGFIDLQYGTPWGLKLIAYGGGVVIDTAVVVDWTGYIDGGDEFFSSIELTQNGANVDCLHLIVNVPDGTIGLPTDTLNGVTIGRIASIAVGQSNISGTSFGQLIIGNDTTAFPTYISGVDGALGTRGFTGETAGNRISRLCDEESIVFSSTGDLDTSETMGPQTTDTVINLLQSCAQTDGGVITEDDVGLRYTTNAARYNAAVALALDYSAGDVAEPPEPQDDDQNLRNDWTVNRTGGGFARFEATGDYAPSGPVGRYPDEVTIDCETDDALEKHAQWRVHLGTVDDLRWPRIDLNFSRSSGLRDDWLAGGQVGARVTIDNPPTETGAESIDLFVEGYTESLTYRQWRVALHCSPARPYLVGVVEGAGTETEPIWRLDSDGSEITVAASSSATSLVVSPYEGNVRWVNHATFPDDFPFDAEVGGERVTVTAATASDLSFVAVGTAAHADNASVSPGIPGGSTAAGDVMILVAAIRTTSGTVSVPTGWTDVIEYANVRVMAKVHSGSESSPSVSFTGGAAGDTCSAQIAAFRGLNRNLAHLLWGGALSTNSSAQNVAYSDLDIEAWNALTLIIGWKQDDWTSVATLSGLAEIAEASTTTGNDQAIVWDYVINDAPVDVSASSFTVTGGASAVSKSLVLCLRGVQTMTVTRSVNGISKSHAAGTAFRLWRPPVVAR